MRHSKAGSAAKAVVLAVFATLAVAASPAAAGTVVGSPNVSSSGTGQIYCSTPPCETVVDQIDGDDIFTPKGVITSWSVRGLDGSTQLLVVRTRPNDFVAGELHATIHNAAASQTGNGSDVVRTANTRKPVEEGDYIAFTLPTNVTSIGQVIGPGDYVFESHGGSTGANVDETTRYNFEPLISATVEPDADGDDYGDQTQDGCPSNASTHGACPAGGGAGSGGTSGSPLPSSGGPFTPVSTAATRKVGLGSRSATYKGGKASLKLTNPNAVAVKVKLALKLGKKVVGSRKSRSYSIAAGAKRTIKVKLAKAARKRIKKRGKVKLSLRLTAKGATGATFKTVAKLTVKKAKKKKRKKRKKKKQQQGGGGSPLDGKYERDSSSSQSIRFTVTGGGRRITNLTGSVGGFCYTFVPGLSKMSKLKGETRTLFPAIESIAVAADGSFSGSQKLSDTTTEITNGKLANGVATGSVSVKSPGCTGKGTFTSRRTG